MSRKVGYSHKEETKKKMSIAHKGRHPVNEFKKGHKFIHGAEKGWFKKGQKLSEVTKQKMRENHLIDGRSYIKCPARYGDDWEQVRQLVYSRDNYICQKCGKHKPLDVHHIIPFMKSFDNSLNNLIALCKSCHTKEEWKLNKIRINK